MFSLPSDISAYNPAVFVVSEVLKQQLAMTKELVDSNRRLHANLMQSLEPPSYRYTTLRDTIQVKHHSPPLFYQDIFCFVVQDTILFSVLRASADLDLPNLPRRDTWRRFCRNSNTSEGVS